MEALSVNEIIVDLNTEKTYRILWIDTGYFISYVIDINEKNALPFLIAIKEIEENVKSGDYTIRVGKGHFLKRIPTTKDIEHRDKTWNIIKELVDLKPDIFMKEHRNKIIKEAMEKHNIGSRNTFLKNLRKFWQRGLTKDCLFPDYALSEKEISYNEKTGRKKKNGKGGIVITQDVKNQFEKSIKKYYLSQKKPSLKYTFKRMTRDYYAKLKYFDEDGNEKVVLKPEEERPTFKQFYYWFDKEYRNDQVTKEREGQYKFEQNFRAILGSSTAETEGPGDIYQIDATPSNIYLVNRFNPNWIVGRPTTYFTVDVNTHLITGLYVGLENASWKAMMNAIVNTCMDKVEYCKKFGITISPEMWPSKHLPSNIIGDRGELASHGVDHLVEGLGPHISNTPPYRPDWKGIVEKLFDTSQEKIKPFLPGYVHEDHGERGAKDYRLEASLSIEEYTKILINFILFYNHNFYMEDYVRSEEQIKDNVQPVPIKLWEWGVKNAAGKLHKHNIDEVIFYLLPRDTVTITEKGIKYKKMLYTTPRALKEGWFSRARQKGSWKVDFSYDPRNMDEIYLHTNDEELFIPCTLVEHHSIYNNKTIEEIEQLIEFEKEDHRDFEHTQLENEINFYSNMESIVKTANINKNEKEDKSLSKSEKTRNINQNKKVEQLDRRTEEALKPYGSEIIQVEDSNGEIKKINNASPLKVSIKQLFANKGRNI
ncbi:Mu transposase C-terminal domain-containing protein [Schinkia azotoformans]|uniref:Mu transposase C-terminal domain-containing protein n=1 Tax=Schinkia azotoformans TaxID=1454 RepID=UPI002DBAAD0B|nr:Mu transposase C-terminal domain-containing protein [Schinkia azotoformans]MEC1698140.1 Mu transposase C-terminal domain-containing protein [Schinkia azotoformans]